LLSTADVQLPINFVLRNIEDLLAVASLQPMPLLYRLVTGSPAAAMGLLSLSEYPRISACAATNRR
jgi:hypothetical protein